MAISDTIEKAIEILAKRASQDPDPRTVGGNDDAVLKYAQAAEHISNAGMILMAIKKAESS